MYTAHTYMYALMSVRVSVVAMVCTWRSEDDLKCPSSLSILFEAGALVHSSACHTGQWISGDSTVIACQLTVIAGSLQMATFASSLYVGLWIQSQILMLVKQVLLCAEQSDLVLLLGAGD